MKKINWKPYAFFIVLTEAVGALSGFITRNGVKAFKDVAKSSLTPPDAVFPIVWGVLFVLIGIGAARAWQTPNPSRRSHAVILYAVQLFFNFFWSIIFFNMRSFGFAFVWLIILLIISIFMAVAFYESDKLAGLLQIPYLLWLVFAAYLNYIVFTLN